MKNTLSFLVVLLLSISVQANPSPALLKLFAETFPSAKDVKWSDDNDGYFVSFRQNNHLQKVFYDKDENFVSSWEYSDASSLPTTVSSVISKNYKDAKIIGVTKISSTTYTFYEVKLTTDNNWYTIKVSPPGKILNEKKYSDH